MQSNRIDALRIVLINIHGLFRGYEQELGRDADTGGQTKYVLELSQALAKHPSVEEVIILTRQVFDPNIDDSYSNLKRRWGTMLRLCVFPVVHGDI